MSGPLLQLQRGPPKGGEGVMGTMEGFRTPPSIHAMAQLRCHSCPLPFSDMPARLLQALHNSVCIVTTGEPCIEQRPSAPCELPPLPPPWCCQTRRSKHLWLSIKNAKLLTGLPIAFHLIYPGTLLQAR